MTHRRRIGVLALTSILAGVAAAQTTTTTLPGCSPSACHQYEDCPETCDDCCPAVPAPGCSCTCRDGDTTGCLPTVAADLDADRFGIIALTQAKLYNLQVCDAGCSVATDCDISAKNGPCGVLQHDDASYVKPLRATDAAAAAAMSQMITGKARFRSKKGRAAMGAVFTRAEGALGIANNDYANVCIAISADGLRTGDRPGPEKQSLFFNYPEDETPGCDPDNVVIGDPENVCAVCVIKDGACHIDYPTIETKIGMNPARFGSTLRSVKVRKPDPDECYVEGGAQWGDCSCRDANGDPVNCDSDWNGVCEIEAADYDEISVSNNGRIHLKAAGPDPEDKVFTVNLLKLGKFALAAVDDGVVIHAREFSIDQRSCFDVDPGWTTPSTVPSCGATYPPACQASDDPSAPDMPSCDADTPLVYVYDKGTVTLGKYSRTHARIYAPRSSVTLKDGAFLSGRVLANYVLGNKKQSKLTDCCQGEPFVPGG